MARQATAVTVWETERVAPCVRCGGATTVAPVAMGIQLGDGYLCDVCFFNIYHGSKARAAEALGLEPEGPDGDDGPDGGPAAPALAPVELAIAAARSARPFTHLSELPIAERAEYERWASQVEVSAPLPVPCTRCNRPASPFETTPEGAVVCWRCWPPARPDVAPAARRVLAAR